MVLLFISQFFLLTFHILLNNCQIEIIQSENINRKDREQICSFPVDSTLFGIRGIRNDDNDLLRKETAQFMQTKEKAEQIN